MVLTLLNILRTEGIQLPKDVHTLIDTLKSIEIANISNGSYIHLYLKNMLLLFLELNNTNIHINDMILKLGVNIEGCQ